MRKRTLFSVVLLMPLTLLASPSRVLAPEIVTVESVDEYEGLLDVGCSLGCAIGWSYQASSTLPGQGANKYDAANLGDASLSSAWIEGAAGAGVGERITITFAETAEPTDGIPFYGIEIVNGYAKNAELWRANARVKKMAVRLEGKVLFELALQDTMSPQAFSFKGVSIRPGDRLELIILEVYPGARYADTAISEIALYGAH